ncbi:hypothetical protein DP116_24185 [Brasilonema bromeliae SPC951]|uniref:Uncharacterized protein n=1 Tax=Brasilonema bromeliae SPC951 TaxID=385972 RepID=A0ABX1PFK8_9CYAN|nr:hypothetical protein [Brasilonema bromeliae SPC951]
MVFAPLPTQEFLLMVKIGICEENLQSWVESVCAAPPPGLASIGGARGDKTIQNRVALRSALRRNLKIQNSYPPLPL